VSNLLVSLDDDRLYAVSLLFGNNFWKGGGEGSDIAIICSLKKNFSF
jgi:hypothetical protein